MQDSAELARLDHVRQHLRINYLLPTDLEPALPDIDRARAIHRRNERCDGWLRAARRVAVRRVDSYDHRLPSGQERYRILCRHPVGTPEFRVDSAVREE